MYKVALFLSLVLTSGIVSCQPLNRSVIRATQYVATDTIKSISGNGINVWNNKIKLLADPVDPQDGVNLRTLIDTIQDFSVNEDSLVHIQRTETITGQKNFTKGIYVQNGNIFKSSVYGTNFIEGGVGVRGDGYIGIVGISNAIDGNGIGGNFNGGSGSNTVGVSGVGTVGGSFTSTDGSGIPIADVVRYNRYGVGSVGYGISSSYYLTNAEIVGGAKLTSRISTKFTNATSGSETSSFEWWLRNNGAAIAKKMDLQGDGTLNVVGNISMGSVLKMTPLTDPPSDPQLGWFYVDTDTHVYLWNGSAWKQLDN